MKLPLYQPGLRILARLHLHIRIGQDVHKPFRLMKRMVGYIPFRERAKNEFRALV